MLLLAFVNIMVIVFIALFLFSFLGYIPRKKISFIEEEEEEKKDNIDICRQRRRRKETKSRF